jgi:hypothetical protein
MKMPDVSEADQHYFERVVEDCDELLGPEVELQALEVDPGAVVVMRLRYRLGTAVWTSESSGETVVAAHAALREKLVLDRIRLGVRALVKQQR